VTSHGTIVNENIREVNYNNEVKICVSLGKSYFVTSKNYLLKLHFVTCRFLKKVTEVLFVKKFVVLRYMPPLVLAYYVMRL